MVRAGSTGMPGPVCKEVLRSGMRNAKTVPEREPPPAPSAIRFGYTRRMQLRGRERTRGQDRVPHCVQLLVFRHPAASDWSGP